MLKCFGTFIFTTDVEFYPKESLAISIQSTGQGPHLKAILPKPKKLSFTGTEFIKTKDPIINNTC